MTILGHASERAIVASVACLVSFSIGLAGASATRVENRVENPSRASPAEIGQPYPALEADAIDGTLVNDARLAGRPFIVDFFATWCHPCHAALADLIAARNATTPTGLGIQFILVDLGESPDVVRRWARTALSSGSLPSDAIVALDPKGVAARRWGTRRLPTTYFVNADGIVRHINRGWGPGYRNRVSRWLRDLAPPKP
ncbi:MAG: TlpA family protein disulfide reductase [Deltaproteobacteria bacterium]|nr:TlpA family protein disulfide reductase [Deltaproteobacteria bacterium]